MEKSEMGSNKTNRYIAEGIEGLSLSPQEVEKFTAEVEEEVPDWARDEDGKIVLTVYYKEAVQMVRERWMEERAKKETGAKKAELKKARKESKK